jgi:hypothetical protein
VERPVSENRLCFVRSAPLKEIAEMAREIGHVRPAFQSRRRWPMAKPDPDIPLEIQPMIDEFYQRFRYVRTIDYNIPLTPPLKPDDARWLREQAQTKRSRR